MFKANFNNINLKGLNLQGGSLTKSTCRFTNFNNCNLRDVDFQGSDLTGATFVGSNLTGANFNECVLTNCDFTDAIFENDVPEELTLFSQKYIREDVAQKRYSYK